MQSIKPADITNDDLIYSIKNLIDSIIRSKVNTILPGEVVSVDKNQASVRALVIEKQSTHPPVIHHNVPVVYPGGGEALYRYPLKEGDQGLLFTCKKDISLFKKDGKPSKTQVDRVFDVNDNVFMPLLFNRDPLDGDEVMMVYKKSKVLLKEGEVSIETKDKVTIKTDKVSIIIEGNKVKVQTDDEVDITSKAVKINCQEMACPPLKENLKAILELLDALANGMVGSGTNATQYRTERPLKEAVFQTIT